MWLVSQLPVLWNPEFKWIRTRILEADLIHLPGNVLFVSDFQITSPDTRYHVDLDDIQHIVIVGDLFETPGYFVRFGETKKQRVEKALRTFIPETFTGNVYFISAYNHDPVLPLFEAQFGGIRFAHIGKYARFDVNGRHVVALHGDELFQGVIGGGLSWLLQRLGLPLLMERIARKRLGLPKSVWLITAHSHVPAIHRETRTANTGSFAGVPCNWLFRVNIGTGVAIQGDDVQLVHFNP
jgi:UDP-2,3-diacylglucosamine pyrophosphatase LpxH